MPEKVRQKKKTGAIVSFSLLIQVIDVPVFLPPPPDPTAQPNPPWWAYKEVVQGSFVPGEPPRRTTAHTQPLPLSTFEDVIGATFPSVLFSHSDTEPFAAFPHCSSQFLHRILPARRSSSTSSRQLFSVRWWGFSFFFAEILKKPAGGGVKCVCAHEDKTHRAHR